MTSTSNTETRIRGMQYVAAFTMGALSVISLVGWAAGDLNLAGRTLRYDAMVPVTALVFLALSVALVLRLRWQPPRGRGAVTGIGLAVLVVVVLELLDFFGRIKVSPDRLFVTAAEMVEGRQIGRMSPVVAVLFAMMASALMLYESSSRQGRRLALVLSLMTAGVGFTFVLGYAYDAPLLLELSPYPPAAFAALGMLLIGLGIAALGLELRPFAHFLGDSVRAQLMRAILPVVVFTALAYAALGIVDVRFGLGRGPIPTSVAIVAVIVAVTSVVLRSALRIGGRVDTAEIDRRAAQEALRESERLYREQFAANSVVMFLMDAGDGHILDVNAAAVDFYGYPAEQFRRMSIRDLSTLTPEKLAGTLVQVNAEGQVRLQVQHRLSDGTLRDVEVSSSLIKLGGKPVVHVIVQDVSKRKAAEQELRAQRENLEALVTERTAALIEANEGLQEATAAKSDFLASMSHELRTPLNSIIGFSDILYRRMAGDLSEEQAKQVGMINRSGKHLLALISDVLDVSKIEAGVVELHVEPVDVEAIVRDTLEIVRPMAEEKGLQLRLSAQGDDWVLRSDGDKVRQILLNLVGNALKFTDEGTVAVEMRRTDAAHVSIAVSDTGRGIPEQDMPRIFEAFTQIATPDLVSPPGTGLGLSISREFSRLLGGEITAESHAGIGSTFTLTLPSDVPATGEPRA